MRLKDTIRIVGAVLLAAAGCAGQDGESYETSWAGVAPGTHNAQVDSVNFPVRNYDPDEKIRVTIQYTNNGASSPTDDWNPGVHFLYNNSSPPWASAVQLTSPLTVGNSRVFSFIAKVPPTLPNGPAAFTATMFRADAQAGAFGQVATYNATIQAGAQRDWACSLVSQLTAVPQKMFPNETRPVLITVSNPGLQTWQNASTFYLVSRDNITGAPNTYGQWGSAATSKTFGAEVQSGQMASVTFNIKAPAVANTYSFAMQLAAQGIVGVVDDNDFCINLPIQVLGPIAGCGDGSLNVGAGEQCDDGDLTNGDGCNQICQVETQIENFAATPGSDERVFEGGSLLSGGIAMDFNGDATTDLVLGQHGNNGQGTVHGIAGGPAFFSGATSSFEMVPAVADGSTFRIFGPQANSSFGARHDGTMFSGSVTGIAARNLVVSAPFADTSNGVDSGAVYVFNTLLLSGDHDLAATGAATVGLVSTINGAGPTRKARVVGVGDFNDDGIDDLFVAEPGATAAGRASAGRILVLRGGALPATINMNSLPAYPSPGSLVAAIIGPAANTQLGARLGVVANFNGSASNDFAIGIPAYTPGANTRAGAVWIVQGPAVTPVTFDLASSFATRIYGVNMYGHLGTSLAAGDFNGDANAARDLAIGAEQQHDPLFSLPASMRGGVHVFNGPVPTGTIDFGAGGDPNATIYGDGSADLFGRTIVSGDINNDGQSDLFIAAPRDDGPNGAESGSAQIVLNIGAMPDVKAICGSNSVYNGYGTRANGFLGLNPQSLILGDFNGDGWLDNCAVAETGAASSAGKGRANCKRMFR